MRSCGPPPTCLLYGERGLRGESNCSDAAIIAVDGSDDGERGFRAESNDILIGRAMQLVSDRMNCNNSAPRNNREHSAIAQLSR